MATARSPLLSRVVLPPGSAPTSLHLVGDAPARVLLLGDGPAVGYTVLSHERALGGCIARELSSSTGRGVIIDIRADARMTPSDARALIRQTPTSRYDAIILTLGTSDAISLTPVRHWASEMARLAEEIATRNTDGVPIVVASIPSIRDLIGLPVDRPRARSHADLLGLGLAATELPDTVFRVALRSHPPGTAPVEVGAGRNRRWARELVAPLVPTIGRRLREEPRADRRSEGRRQDALRRSRLMDGPCPAEFEQIVSALHGALELPIAAVNLIDHRALHPKAIVGLSVAEIPRRGSFCDQTIRSGRSLIVPDAGSDARFAHSDLVVGSAQLTSYAGHPIESPDGERIGSLCAIGYRRREFSTSDIITLQKLAFRAQDVLYDLR